MSAKTGTCEIACHIDCAALELAARADYGTLGPSWFRRARVATATGEWWACPLGYGGAMAPTCREVARALAGGPDEPAAAEIERAAHDFIAAWDGGAITDLPAAFGVREG